MIYWILFAILVFIIWIYVRFNYKVPTDIVILQTSLQDFDLKRLLEKQPIVVQDRVDNIQPIWDGWFKYNIKGHFEITPEMEWIRNKHKYMLIHGLEDGEILLCNPNCKVNNYIPDPTEEVMAIKLYKGMSIIIPYRWYFAVTKTVYASGIHDLFTYMLPS